MKFLVYHKTEHLEIQRQKAIAYLGQRWVLHPKYVPVLNHSNRAFRPPTREDPK